jgi:hypothetical protein
MTLLRNVNVGFQDGPQLDAFGRVRVGMPETIFDNKQNLDAGPLVWDDQEVSGSGTSSVHSAFRASSIMTVSSSTAGKRVRQTFVRPNYRAGKSQLVRMTGILGEPRAGITARLGQFDENNGLFFESGPTSMAVGIRSSVSGSPVDTTFARAAWNDPLDGTGPSGVTVDFDKAHQFVVDYEWLGVGRVRWCITINGQLVEFHSFDGGGATSVYMSTPNNPLRWEIANDGAGGAASVEHICSTVITEGNGSPVGILKYVSTDGNSLGPAAADVHYALLGIRLKATSLQASIVAFNISVISETNDDFEWHFTAGAAIAGTFNYVDEPGGHVQIARGDTSNTVTGGINLVGGLSKSDVGSTLALPPSPANLGAAIDGTPTEIVLVVRSLGANGQFEAAGTLVEVQ